MPADIITDDRRIVHVGDRVYNYYDMEPGAVETEPETEGGFAGWFYFRADNGKRTLLNGARICTIEFARSRGFKGV